MSRLIEKFVRKLAAPLWGWRFRQKLKAAFGDSDFCYVSSNCVGGRFSQLLGRAYRSPTVGLWFEPRDYLRFVADLHANLRAELGFDAELSRQRGYPVGVINGIRINFMHYASADEAAQKWAQRARRVVPDQVFLIFTDRDGATLDDLRAFNALPYARKLALTHRPYPELASVVAVPGYASNGQVGDIYSEWQVLDRAFTTKSLARLAGRSARLEALPVTADLC